MLYAKFPLDLKYKFKTSKMKKIIAIVILLFGLTINANAQDKKVVTATANSNEKISSEGAAKKDIAALISIVSINESLKKDMYTLMIMKHDALANTKLSPAERETISKKFGSKVISGLNEAQQKQLSSHPEVLQQLSH